MRCPACGRETPDALMDCSHCGARTQPSMLRRLWGRLRGTPPSVSVNVRTGMSAADDFPGAIEMPVGVRTMSVTMTELTGKTEPLARLDQLDPELRANLLDAMNAGGGEVKVFERIEREDGQGNVTFSESTTPSDPAVRAAIEQLIRAHPTSGPGSAEQQIVVEVDGARHVYQSVDELPPEVRKLVDKFADRGKHSA